jgi:uncharacterized protein YbjT (DUF2867 family)
MLASAVIVQSDVVIRATAEAFLQRGYRVRGVTRDAAKGTLLQAKFDSAFGHGQFELVAIQDAAQPGAYKAALEGASGLVHLASDT